MAEFSTEEQNEMEREFEQHEELKKQINDLKERSIFVVSNWWGFKYAGSAGTVVTANKELYVYQNYFLIPENLKDK